MIRYYQDYIMKEFFESAIKPSLKSVIDGVEMSSGPSGLETPEALEFVRDLYRELKKDLNQVLEQRIKDRKFIDERCKVLFEYNLENEIDLLDPQYQTLLGLKDENDRIVVGPKSDYKTSNGHPVADIPEHLKGIHVTLFGPPGEEKMSINAMNAYHRKLKNEPAIIGEILKDSSIFPKWGADDEDSKTPLHEDLTQASANLSKCFEGTIEFKDEKRGKEYKLAEDHLSLPIKRFPGLALPCPFMFVDGEPLPMHMYDFALHFFHHYHDPKALTFYVPKLENEEEAAYIKKMFELAEKKIQSLKDSTYKLGTVRCIIVLENPRAVFRVNEIMDELYPYFVGASLGWHDYLGSTARLLKEEGNYRIPVKADPDIVIKYIKASHELLSDVVGARGGIKIGGMYGILPLDNELMSESFQMTMRGYFRDVITQMKRNLSGFWVAHPDFVRIGIAMVEAWHLYAKGDIKPLKILVESLLVPEYQQEVWSFIEGEDIKGLDKDHERYARSLIVADIKESSFIANNHPDEIRYNVFQSLQYITDWLTGNGCVALPAMVDGVSVRVMDDLATAERSRWEVWHELYHGRFELSDFIQIVYEEMHFIRKDLSHPKKIVQIKYTPENSKWYDCAVKIMLKLMTDIKPAEFATELLLPFTVEAARVVENPWSWMQQRNPRFSLRADVEKLSYYFEMCGCLRFAETMAELSIFEEEKVQSLIQSFAVEEIIEAASFHGNIGEKKGLDKMASQEQAGVEENLQDELKRRGQDYLEKFGFKYLISAQGKTGHEMLEILNQRMGNSRELEIENAKKALCEITLKRIAAHPLDTLKKKLTHLFERSTVKGLQLAVNKQTIGFGISPHDKLQIASLSKTIGTAFAIEVLKREGLRLNDSVNSTIKKFEGEFQLELDCQLQDLMRHTALNMHYVNGVGSPMPPIEEFLQEKHRYEKIQNLGYPGKKFHYSGAGFIVLEYILKLILKQDPRSTMDTWLKKLGIENLTMDQDADGLMGLRDSGETIKLNFPSIAAGGQGTAGAVLDFLGKIDPHTLAHMTYGKDLGAQEFMGANIGLGTFILEAGQNRFALHQGANDGFRGVYLYCYQGPDKGFGLCALAQGELAAVELIAKVMQVVLKDFKIKGINYQQFESNFEASGLKQEEIVNRGYKDLVFKAFEKDRAVAIEYDRLKKPMWEQDLLKDATILAVSNDKFARIENLISPFEPAFDPAHFCSQGKVMDSWESPRHNEAEFDWAKIQLKKPSAIQGVEISTKYHLGNQVEAIEILDQDGNSLLEKTPLKGHALRQLNIDSKGKVSSIEIRIYPDGGLTRLRLYEEKITECDEIFEEIIPTPKKPLALPTEGLPISRSRDLADLTKGAKIISASNEHYAPASSILSPLAPLSMFDGFESARTRQANAFEEICVELAESADLGVIELDFTYFVNNNPMFIEIWADNTGEWQSLIPRSLSKPFAGKVMSSKIDRPCITSKLRIRLYPCGGFNRLRVYAKPS